MGLYMGALLHSFFCVVSLSGSKFQPVPKFPFFGVVSLVWALKETIYWKWVLPKMGAWPACVAGNGSSNSLSLVVHSRRKVPRRKRSQHSTGLELGKGRSSCLFA